MNKKHNITANDVAKLAGVSPSTVSRVISNNPKISKATRDKVLKSMKKLGYYPNANARSLAMQKTGTVGIIIPTTSEDYFSNPFFSESLRGIIRGASNSDYDLLISTNTEKDDEIKIIQRFIRASKVDGVILMTSKVQDEGIKYLLNIDFPFSLIGSYPGGNINQVDNDNALASYELTQHILNNNRKNIALLIGDLDLVVSKKRLLGYKEALKEEGIKYNPDLVFSGSFDEEIGYYYGKKISKMNPMPDGLVVADDLVAIGVLNAFEDLGIKVGKDISIASFNNSVFAKYSTIPLTSVDINAMELGKASMELLTDAIEEDTRGKIINIPHKIYIRESSQ